MGWTLGQELKVHDVLDTEVVVSVARSIVAGVFGIDISCQGVGDRLGRCRGVWEAGQVPRVRARFVRTSPLSGRREYL